MNACMNTGWLKNIAKNIIALLLIKNKNYIEAEINLEDRYCLLNSKNSVHSVDIFLFFFD